MANINGNSLMRKKNQPNQTANAMSPGNSALNQPIGFNPGVPGQPLNVLMMNLPSQPNIPVAQGPQLLGGNRGVPPGIVGNTPNCSNLANKPNPATYHQIANPVENQLPGAQLGFQQPPGNINPYSQANSPLIHYASPDSKLPDLHAGPVPNQIPNIPPPHFQNTQNMYNNPSDPQNPLNLPNLANQQLPGQILSLPPPPISQPPIAQKLRNSITVPCPIEIAQRLIDFGIQPQLIMQFELQEATYNDGCFELSALKKAKVVQAKLSLLEMIGKFPRKSEEKPQWAWMTDDGSFAPYHPITSMVIEAAYQRKAPNVMVSLRGIQYEIKFGNAHMQIMPQSNMARAVRRIVKGEEDQIDIVRPGDVTWFWQDHSKKFKPYTPEFSRLIECAYQIGINEVAISRSKDNVHLVDIPKRIQMNERTGFKRPVKRGNPNY